MENIDSTPQTSEEPVLRRSDGYPEINDRLFIAMKINGFRQISKFAEVCGFSRPYMSAIVHKRIKPTLERAEVIACKLNLRVQDVFEISDLRIPEIDNLIKDKEDKNG